MLFTTAQKRGGAQTNNHGTNGGSHSLILRRRIFIQSNLKSNPVLQGYNSASFLKLAAGSRCNPQPSWLRHVVQASQPANAGIFQMPTAHTKQAGLRTLKSCALLKPETRLWRAQNGFAAERFPL
ncbi:MAG: hypothetical protein ABSC01_03240 [Verrucomicrobiota bacterium]